MAARSFRSRAILVLAALAVVGWAAHGLWLPKVGWFLVQEDEIRPSDVVVVLAGDYSGTRVRFGVELVAQGAAPLALLNGSRRVFLDKECAMAAEYAESLAAGAAVEPFCFEAASTAEEAAIVDRELVARGVESAIVVTSNFHTRRARMIFRDATSGAVRYAFAAAPTPGFDPDRWWLSRSGKKTLVLEYLKLLNSSLEAAG